MRDAKLGTSAGNSDCPVSGVTNRNGKYSVNGILSDIPSSGIFRVVDSYRFPEPMKSGAWSYRTRNIPRRQLGRSSRSMLLFGEIRERSRRKHAAGTNVSRKSLRWDWRLEANLNRKANGLALEGPSVGLYVPLLEFNRRPALTLYPLCIGEVLEGYRT